MLNLKLINMIGTMLSWLLLSFAATVVADAAV